MSRQTLSLCFALVSVLGLVFCIVRAAMRGMVGDFETDPDPDADFAHPGWSFFRPVTIALMAIVFGGTGVAGTLVGLTSLTTVGAASAAALLSAWVWYVARQYLLGTDGLAGPQADAWSRKLVGSSGQVLKAIPEHGTGEVGCQMGVSLVVRKARSTTGEALPMDTRVRIESAIGDVLIVSGVEGP